MLPHHKGKRLDRKAMLGILRELDDNLIGIPRKINLYCLGGTVLVLSDLRHSSKDVDFILSREDFRTLSEHIAEIEWKKKVTIDIFPDGLLPKYQYPNYKKHAKKMNFSFENIEIYYLDTVDLVLTKALAGRDTDIKDIHLLAPSKEVIPKDELIQRFNNIIPATNKTEELKNKFDLFISEFYK